MCLIQAETPDHGTWRYSYDAVGRRTAKYRVTEDGAVADQSLFVWDGPRLAEQRTSGGEGVAVTLTWDYEPYTFRPHDDELRQRLRTSLEAAGWRRSSSRISAVLWSSPRRHSWSAVTLAPCRTGHGGLLFHHVHRDGREQPLEVLGAWATGPQMRGNLLLIRKLVQLR
jgi:hypothetical protein